MNLAILILSAGNSSRLGQPKQLVNFNGKPLLQERLELCLSLGPDVYCVLGAHAQQIRQQVGHPFCRFLYHCGWQDGLSSSIAFGVTQLPADTTAVLIMLADLWALTADDLQQLIDQYRQQPDHIHASYYNHRFGAPVIFPAPCFASLKQLPPGNSGAKSVLTHYQDKVVKVALDHAAADLDTPQQLLDPQFMELSHG